VKDETKKRLADMQSTKRKAALESVADKARETMQRKKKERLVSLT